MEKWNCVNCDFSLCTKCTIYHKLTYEQKDSVKIQNLELTEKEKNSHVIFYKFSKTKDIVCQNFFENEVDA